MLERRSKRRRVLAIHFNCYVDGERFDSESLDISPHGALLVTKARVPAGKRILIVPTGQPELPVGRKDSDDPAAHFPVLLSAQVIRRQDAPEGLGITWTSGISHVGIDPLLVVINYILGRSSATLTPPEAEVILKQDISYDFLDERFRVLDAPDYYSDSLGISEAETDEGVPVDQVQDLGPITQPVYPPPWISQTSVDPEDDFSPLPTYHGFESNAASGQLTELLSSGPAQVRLMKAVQAKVEGGDVGALIHNIGLQSLLLIIPGDKTPGLERLTVVLPVAHSEERSEVLLRCTVSRIMQFPDQGAVGYKLWILSVDETVPGLYTRYIKYLFEQSFYKNG